MMAQKKPIGIRIYELRKGNSMTRKELADAAGVVEDTIAALEMQKTKYARPSIVEAICKALHADVFDLISNTDYCEGYSLECFRNVDAVRMIQQNTRNTKTIIVPVENNRRESHFCSLFYCVKDATIKRCCHYCEDSNCDDPCLNAPDRCGLYVDTVKAVKDDDYCE